MYIFICLLLTVLSAGARITKAYLPAVIMKALSLCGMLSLDPKPDHFRYTLHGCVHLFLGKIYPCKSQGRGAGGLKQKVAFPSL